MLVLMSCGWRRRGCACEEELAGDEAVVLSDTSPPRRPPALAASGLVEKDCETVVVCGNITFPDVMTTHRSVIFKIERIDWGSN